MKKIFVYLLALVPVILSIAGCNSGTIPDSGLKERSAPETPGPQKIAVESEWEKVVASAKKEGFIVLYGAFGIAQARDPFIRGIKEKFGISLDATVAQGPQLTTKLENERRAGLFLADVYMGGGQSIAISLIPQKMFEPIEPYLILPEVKDPSAWMGSVLPVWDSQRQAFASLANTTSFIAINNTLVKPEELASFRDLLNPKFKGLIVMADPTTPGAGSNWFHSANYFMGADYLKDFLTQNIVLTRDLRLMTDWLAKGKYAVGIGVDSAGIRAAIKDGAPLSMLPIFKEGIVVGAGAGNILVMNNPAHPNAAKVFVNWALSKEGQTILSKATGMASRRLDVPTDHLERGMVPDMKIKYIWETEQYIKEEGKNMELAKEIFAPLLK